MASSDSKIAKIQTHFQTLSSVATSLNSASDELTKVVGVLDEALKKLNIGLTVWVTFAEWSDEHDVGITQLSRYTCDQIGYCKVNGKWGIALQSVSGDDAGQDEPEGPWLFNDAPRDMRLQAVDKIPEVIEKLGSEASSLVTRVQEKTKQVRELATAIEQVAKPPHPNAFNERVLAAAKNQLKLDAETSATTLRTIGDMLAKAKEGSK
jgi:hypothetical protein